MQNKSITRNILGVLFFLLISFVADAQRKIEKIQSDEDVVKFVKNYFQDDDDFQNSWKKFQLVDGTEWKGLYNLSKNTIDSLSNIPINKWKIVDFNFDKKPDLIVSGKIVSNAGVKFSLLVFLSNKDGEYDFKPIVPDEFESYPYYFSLLTLPKINVTGIRLVKWFPDVNNVSHNGDPFTIDTLGFAQNYLVNFNAHPDSAIFKKVKFESLNFDGKRIVVTISDLDKGMTSPFTIVIYNSAKDSSLIRGKITMDLYAQLLSTINYSGFKELPNQFQANVSTPQTFILDVNYADGFHKKVEDFSAGGTYTLLATYLWFDWLIDYSTNSLLQRKLERKSFQQDTF